MKPRMANVWFRHCWCICWDKMGQVWSSVLSRYVGSIWSFVNTPRQDRQTRQVWSFHSMDISPLICQFNANSSGILCPLSSYYIIFSCPACASRLHSPLIGEELKSYMHWWYDEGWFRDDPRHSKQIQIRIETQTICHFSWGFPPSTSPRTPSSHLIGSLQNLHQAHCLWCLAESQSTVASVGPYRWNDLECGPSPHSSKFIVCVCTQHTSSKRERERIGYTNGTTVQCRSLKALHKFCVDV